MQSQVKLARAGLALLFVLVPGALAMQGCASQASSATLPAETAHAAAATNDATPYVDATQVFSSDDVQFTSAGHDAAVAAGSQEAVDAYGSYRDGVYTASAQGKCGPVPVTVTISAGRIDRISVGDNAESPAMAQKAQETVVPQIIAAQSVDGVDTATGATLTSEAILSAVATALGRAAW